MRYTHLIAGVALVAAVLSGCKSNEQLAQNDASYTGQYLRPILAEGRSHAYATGR